MGTYAWMAPDRSWVILKNRMTKAAVNLKNGQSKTKTIFDDTKESPCWKLLYITSENERRAETITKKMDAIICFVKETIKQRLFSGRRNALYVYHQNNDHNLLLSALVKR